MNTAINHMSTPDRLQQQRHRPYTLFHWSYWAWMFLLLMVNLPLVWGEVRDRLIFLPGAVADGEWFRVITYPLVHLSWYHLLLDGAGFLILLACLDEDRLPAKCLYLGATSAGALLMTLGFDPAVFHQGLSGLSGVAHGLMVITAFEMMGNRQQRHWGTLSLCVVVLKSVYEFWSGQVLFEFMHMGMCGRPLAASHIGGVMGGALGYGLVALFSGRLIRPMVSFLKGGAQPVPRASLAQSILMALARRVVHTLYRVRYQGLSHIPQQGPAVLVCNHVSYVDWLFIAAASPRPIHFVMHAAIYQKRWLNWVVRLGKAIPIDSGKNHPAILRQGFQKIARTLQAGGLVCIFPEGRLTRTGRMDRFRPGIERIIQMTPVPVIPLALRGLWGSFFSYQGGRAMRRPFHKFWARVDMVVGRCIPPHRVTVDLLRKEVLKLCGDQP